MTRIPKKKKKNAIQKNLLWLAVIDQPNCTTASYLEALLPLRFAICKLDPIAGRDSAGSAVFAHHSCYSKGASIVTIATTLTEEAGWPAVSRVANNSLASLVWLWVKGSLGQTFKAWEHCPNMRLLHRIYFILAQDTWENMFVFLQDNRKLSVVWVMKSYVFTVIYD